MNTIAVAGGTGGVGKTIVETLLQERKYQVIVLTRGVRPLHGPYSKHAYLHSNI